MFRQVDDFDNLSMDPIGFFVTNLPILKKVKKLLYHIGYGHSIGLVKEPNKVPNCIQMILSSIDSLLLGK